MDIKNLNYLEL